MIIYRTVICVVFVIDRYIYNIYVYIYITYCAAARLTFRKAALDDFICEATLLQKGHFDLQKGTNVLQRGQPCSITIITIATLFIPLVMGESTQEAVISGKDFSLLNPNLEYVQFGRYSYPKCDVF